MSKEKSERDAMVVLSDGFVLLRDFIERDINDYVRWETVETEWKLWDAPWEHEDKTTEAAERELEDDIAWMRRHAREVSMLSDEDARRRFEICLADSDDPRRATHVGGVSTYRIDETCEIVENGTHLALGIDINDETAQGRGCAYAALRLFTRYLFDCGWPELYCQTWSGNERMLGLARKLGFVECRRRSGVRKVRGGRYDALTFVLERPAGHMPDAHMAHGAAPSFS